MEIPDFEELQWLEAHCMEDPWEEEDYVMQMEEPPSPTPPPDPDESPNRPILTLPTLPSLSNPIQVNSTLKKRIRPGDHRKCNLDPYYSRKKKCKTGEDEDLEEEWNFQGPHLEEDEATKATVPEILHDNGDALDDSIVEEETESGKGTLSRYASEIDGDCVPITGLDGDLVFAKICEFQMDEERRTKNAYSREGLLVESVRVLMEKIEHEDFTKAVQATMNSQSGIDSPKPPDGNEQLWVEKYAPSSFTELLSDEKTNREVLLWLKQWDCCVFGSSIKSTADDVLCALSRHSLSMMHSRKSGKTSNFGSNRESGCTGNSLAPPDLDEENNINLGTREVVENRNKFSSPPEKKILLLCGPPGLGKTTLAHVAARHCGYQVVEINASDDRSASVVETKILDVVQMNSVIAGSKPKCLVIDEIDGALGDGKGAIEVILKLVSAERKNFTGKENLDERFTPKKRVSSKRQRNSPLLRPVICICNDLYAPALRPLREVAKVHIFVQPSVNRVVNRLRYICNNEKIKMSSVALSALANFTGCDIRSCLNTLQFLNKKKESLNLLDLGSQVVCLKDVSKGTFDVWKEIFQRRKAKWIKGSTYSGSFCSENFEFLFSLISNHGEYDLILDGVHENMLQLHYVDPVMEKTVQCLDNLEVSDIVHKYIMQTQKMSLQAYQPPVVLLIRGLVARPEKYDIRWPRSFHRHRTALTERLDTLHKWHNLIPPYISRHLSTKSFIENSVSQLLHILSPSKIRPVALNLLSETEKSSFWQLVSTMVSYAVTYKNTAKMGQEEVSETNFLSLDPPLFNFVRFKGCSACHLELPLAVKQVLLHEVEKQRILHCSLSKSFHHNMAENTSTGEVSSVPTETKGKNPTSTTNNSGLHALSNSSPASFPIQVAATAAQVKSSERKKYSSGFLTDFFQRSKSSSSHEDSPLSMTVEAQRSLRTVHPFLFKFNEGFTNAVKRPVRMREFLA